MIMLWIVLINIFQPTICRRSFRDISTTQGWVRGYLVESNIYAYLGIPYAQTSAHSRFKAPKPPRRWDSIFEATHRVACPQSNESGDENCLVVNVFTPNNGTSLPVLVYLHGGGFQKGCGPVKPMKLLIDRNIIIVTFNYRLGPLGFLCLKVARVPGNAGLKDQIAALYWIHRNIKNFGGNPLDITIYGTESGAVSLQFLLISRLAEGLFQKAILEDGSILSPKSINKDPIALAYVAAKTLNYSGKDNGKELANFYLKLNLKQILNITEEFLPCIEGDSYYPHSLVDSDPYEKLEQGNFQNTPIIIMHSNKKSSDDNTVLDEVPDNLENFLPSNLEFPDHRIKTKVAEIVKNYYFEECDDYRRCYANYLDDILLHYPIVKLAMISAIRNSQPVFLMTFSQPIDSVACTSKDDCGITDLLYSNMKENEWIQQTIVTFITNFIKLGDPTPIITASTPIIWPPIKMSPYGRFNSKFIPQLTIGNKLTIENVVTQEILFWSLIYDKFYREHDKDEEEIEE